MPFGYFSKINKGTSWQNLKVNDQTQSVNNRKKIEFIIIASIVVPKKEFDVVGSDISVSHACYQNFTRFSVANTFGLWQCIELRNNQDFRKLILYTAGRTYPLYAAIWEGR